MIKKFENNKSLTAEEALVVCNQLLEKYNIIDEDLRQDCYLVAIQAMKSGNNKHTYIYSSVKNFINGKKFYNRIGVLIYIDYNYTIDRQIINQYIIKECIERISLTEREKIIFKLRFEYDYTYSEISKYINLSLERTRQIVLKILRKIKYSKYKNLLYDIYNESINM